MLSLCLASPAFSQTTVVFLPGLGDGKTSFAKIIRTLQAEVTIFADARPDTMPGDADGRRNGDEVAQDLHNRLAAAGRHPPYLLVGHSLGGTYALSFAQRYPAEVTGIVLADARLPGFEAACRAHNLNACSVPPLMYAMLPAVQKLELDGMAETAAALGSPADFGTLPITVIVATKPALGLGKDWQAVWIDTAITFAAGLQNGTLVHAEGARHYVQRDSSPVVEGEIRRMLSPKE
ncbi:MAG: alpha/beta fold hydrolase [Paracoccaceae bacterium]